MRHFLGARGIVERGGETLSRGILPSGRCALRRRLRACTDGPCARGSNVAHSPQRIPVRGISAVRACDLRFWRASMPDRLWSRLRGERISP